MQIQYYTYITMETCTFIFCKKKKSILMLFVGHFRGNKHYFFEITFMAISNKELSNVGMIIK